jgi:protein-L-isoaspartate(D-aspartate) O-methyltransferase
MNSLLVKHLLESGALRTPRIIAGFEAIDRKDFVPDQFQAQAYADHPLPIGFGVTISQPTTVAFMLELLAVEQGDRVLDIGAGSGWTTALLCYIADTGGVVFGVERIPELVEIGNRNLHKYFPLAQILQAGEQLGAQEKAPFNRILVSAAADDVPADLILQLQIGGRIVLPVRESIVKIDRISADRYEKEEYPGFMFVPLKQR